ncbi:histone acetyltransferase HAC1-like isoform X1 [Primulina huaijiensis]|uniref:histone acetyltransferase HAC1-like isoform X1 n=1 Tax=Primulina huaijiensis TaxID=1492673 RepID=UPI003CC75866
MSLQTIYSGNITGQIPNQACNPLPGPPQQNGSALPSQTQSPSIHHNALNRNPDFVKARKYMQAKIYEILMHRKRQSPELSNKKMIDIVKRLEEGLFRSALSKDEYLNMATLENRLHALIKRPPMRDDNQQFSHVSSSFPIGMMIPTPGLSRTNNSTLTSTSVDSSVVSSNGTNTMVSPTFNNGSFFPAGNVPSGSAPCGSLNTYDGSLAGLYQQSNGFSINSGGINMVSSVGVQKMRSQMIPTPGFNNPNNDGLSDKAINSCPMNLKSSKNISMFPTVETFSSAAQSTQQNQQFGSQNSHISRDIEGHMGSGIRSTFEQRSNGLSNGPVSGGMGIMANNISQINSAGTSECYLTDNSAQPLHERFDQHHLPIMQGDGYEISAAYALGSGSFYVPVTSVGSMTNDESLNATSSQSMPKINSHLMTNRPSIHFTQQMKNVKTESIDELEKMNHLSNYPVKENVVQCLQHQQLEQPYNQFHCQQVVGLQKQQNEDQLLLKKNNFSPSHQSSSIVPGYKSGLKKELLNDGLHLQVSEPSEFSDIHNQFQQNSMEDHSRATPLTQRSDQMQQLSHPQHFVANPQNDFKDISIGIRHNGALCGQWYSNSQDGSRVSGRPKLDKTVREDFGHEVCEIDEDQRNNMCSKVSVNDQHDASGSAKPPTVDKALCRSNFINRERDFKNQQRWILFLLHARKCSAPVGKCQESNCILAQKLLAHLDCCNAIKCPFPRCNDTKGILDHRRHCQNASCPVCIPVKNFLLAQRKAVACSDLRPGLLCPVNGSSKTCDTAEIAGQSGLKTSSVIAKNSEDLEPSRKRMKTEQTSPFFVSEGVRSPSLVSDVRNELLLQDAQRPELYDDSHIPVKSESSEVRVEIHESVMQSNHKNVEMKNDKLDDTSARRPDAEPNLSSNPSVFGAQDFIQIEKEMDQSKPETMLISCDNASKSGKPKINGVSLTELFTPEQVRQHIKGLRQWVGQSKAKAEKNQAMGHSMNENSCQLCAVEKLNFEPLPIYCTPCGARIKRNAMYYTFGAGDTRHSFCIPCYNEARGDTIVVDRTSIPKTRVEKKKNDDNPEEGWVQCDKCEAWQHQICALFNGKRNDGGQAEYTCPNCYILEVERGERIPLPHSAVLGAKDLPKTILSDHIEQRLFSRLKHERQERALRQGKAYDEVPGAEALVVRVVSSVDKKMEVKPRFSEIFQEKNYPTEFSYKSKVILLFQNIEGVEVCLFGMYVQEFGSECQQPNHRRVYLAYLDSVKYFRPDIRAVTGEALRTFVYHEILIGYLDYCKQRGFTSCYIWACPPVKGEDYILYCHPEIQKTPKSDKLREWYLSMLKKAERENIVVGLTNLYDHFFVCTGESKAKVTAARLPYFDGDYWPGSAEDIIYQMQQEDDGIKQQKKGFLKKTITKRALKASGQTDLTGNASKDLMLLHKLGGTISPMKEDFIMVHLQHTCTHCCILMVSGNRWVCKQCKKFQLCDMCYDAEQKLEDRERHPVNHKDRHALHPVQITGVPDDTKDKDGILVSEFFDTRQAFMNLCQVNNYQYDTLRRAKHSSMMILYHLHNPTAPSFLATCSVCRLVIEAGQGWRCETCPDYEICNACYQKEGGLDHPHKLTNNPSNDRDVQNIGARESRVIQLTKMLNLLVHASMCRFPNCQYPNCRGVKGLFLHARTCKKRAAGGCVPCRRMWRILQIHSQACKESECLVPRCRDLRVHMKRLQQQSESRRRAAVMEMMRQRAAEVACSS